MMNNTLVETPSKSDARIRNPRLQVIVRVGMLAFFILITAVGVTKIPAYYQDIRNDYVADSATLAYLTSLGISVQAGAAYSCLLFFLQSSAFTVAGFYI